VFVSITFISYPFTLGVVIKKTIKSQKSWTNQRIENARSVESCIGILSAECASRLFYRSTKLNFNYSPCYQRLFIKKKKTEIELSSGDEDDVIEVKPKPEEIEPCCSSSLKD
jgi:hypothetical protein